jgi:hypothetical protein
MALQYPDDVDWAFCCFWKDEWLVFGENVCVTYAFGFSFGVMAALPYPVEVALDLCVARQQNARLG